MADCDFGLRRADTSKTGQLNRADPLEHTRGKPVNDRVLRGKASVRNFRIDLEEQTFEIRYANSGNRGIRKGLAHLQLFLAVGTGLRATSPEMPEVYILDCWAWGGGKDAGTKATMLSAITEFITKLENVEPKRTNVSNIIMAISKDAPPSVVKDGAKEGYPPVGVIKGCPFIVGTLDGGKIAGREDLVEGFLFKMGIK